MKRTGDPQLEDGYTKIANEILEVLMCSDLSKREQKVIDAIFRFSYGCGKKYTILSRSEIAYLCNLHRPDVSIAISLLIKKRILKEDPSNTFWFNKRYLEWEVPKKLDKDKDYFKCIEKIAKRNISKEEGIVSKSLTPPVSKLLTKSEYFTNLLVSKSLTPETGYQSGFNEQFPDQMPNTAVSKSLTESECFTNSMVAETPTQPCIEAPLKNLNNLKKKEKKRKKEDIVDNSSISPNREDIGRGEEGGMGDKPLVKTSVFTPSDLMNLWNEMCAKKGLPKCIKLTKKRAEHARARLKEQPERQWWIDLFTKITNTPFLCGKNDRGWMADFDWIIRNEDNPLKVLEGKYETKMRKEEEHGRQQTYRRTSGEAYRKPKSKYPIDVGPPEDYEPPERKYPVDVGPSGKDTLS